MSDLRINFIDNWEKKDIDLEELKRALEDGTHLFTMMQVLRKCLLSGRSSRREGYLIYTF